MERDAVRKPGLDAFAAMNRVLWQPLARLICLFLLWTSAVTSNEGTLERSFLCPRTHTGALLALLSLAS